MSLKEATINAAMAVYEGISNRGLMGSFRMDLMKTKVSLLPLSRIKGLEKKGFAVPGSSVNMQGRGCYDVERRGTHLGLLSLVFPSPPSLCKMTRQNECTEAEMSECMDVRISRCYKSDVNINNVVDVEEKKEKKRKKVMGGENEYNARMIRRCKGCSSGIETSNQVRTLYKWRPSNADPFLTCVNVDSGLLHVTRNRLVRFIPKAFTLYLDPCRSIPEAS